MKYLFLAAIVAIALPSCVVPVETGPSYRRSYPHSSSYRSSSHRDHDDHDSHRSSSSYGSRDPRRSPYSRGGSAITPSERNPRSPYSRGGSKVTPKERRDPRSPYSPGGSAIVPGEVRRSY